MNAVKQIIAAASAILALVAACSITWFVLAWALWLIAMILAIMGAVYAGYATGRYVYGYLSDKLGAQALSVSMPDVSGMTSGMSGFMARARGMFVGADVAEA